MSDQLRTIDLARAAGISTQMVRNYEQVGFLPPAERSPAGYRRYTARHLHALRAARAMIGGHGWQPARQILHAVHHGDLPAALALVDACHAELHQRRREIEATLGALRAVAAALPEPVAARALPRPGLTIGAAARRVGVRVSALRFWEEQGLLQPERDPASGYRRYNDEQLRRLQVVALLRQGGYDFAAIHAVLDELAAGQPGRAIDAAERRLKELSAASQRCTEATTAFWEYVRHYAPVDTMKG
ncbi:MAG: MerR family transcriptional regulator [Roseiflexaceae bacterium]